MRGKILLAIFLLSLSGLSFFLAVRFFINQKVSFGAIQVTSTPKAGVSLDNEPLGSTPFFSEKIKSGQHLIKIVPEGQDFAFEQTITVKPSLLTAVDRTFRKTEIQSEGSILTLDPISNKNSSEVIVLSTPPEAKASLDNELKGVTPLEIKEVTVSGHEIELEKEGYENKKIRIKTTAGYRLTANVKLAISLEEEKEASPTPRLEEITPSSASPSVKIKQTPTGFLRVRFSPSLQASEVARVKPGETFPLLEETSNWTKIKLPDGTVGWVSEQYITLTEF